MFPVNFTDVVCRMGSSTDMEVHQLRLLELDTDHLYRHLTEVNGKDTRVRRTKQLHMILHLRGATSRASWNLHHTSLNLPLV